MSNTGKLTIGNVLVVLLIFSLGALPGLTPFGFHFPSVPLSRAVPTPACGTLGTGGSGSCPWYPAGPAMDTLQNTIFTDESAEFTDIQSASPSIDLTDWPLTPDLISPFTTSTGFYITPPTPLNVYYDFQFMLANNFWGCDFNYGNSQCGIEIRQGIAHMIDKAKFVADEPSIAGQAVAVDSPVPMNNGGLPSPNPCGWDASFVQIGSQCIVGARQGTAYHLANSTGANGFSWLPAPSSPDLCAAADHFIAAGIATGKNANCQLTGISSVAASHVPNLARKSSNPALLHYGDGIGEEICYLFTGSYAVVCSYLNGGPGPPCDCFPGYLTSTTAVNRSWWMYTGAYDDIYPFDASLYYRYNSRFVSGISSIQSPSGPCSNNSVPSYAAPDYTYLCNQNYDRISAQMEYAPCIGNGPAPGQPSNNAGDMCPNTAQLSAMSAGVETEDAYGRGAYSIPIFSRSSAQYGYLPHWQRVINKDGEGLPNFFTWLNSFNPNPIIPGTIRQAFKEATSSVNPYNVRKPWDLYILRDIYDRLMVTNPYNATQVINWMAIANQQLPLSDLTYTPPSGTVATYRFTLRDDMFFQDGRKVTSFDVAFTYLSMLATGAQSAAIASMTGITILGPDQFDINLGAIGPNTLRSITSLPILPGRYWTNSQSMWDSNVASCGRTSSACFPAQYTLVGGTNPTCALNCTFPATNMNVDPAKITPSYDPIANHILIGSGPWQCGTPAALGFACSSSSVQNPGAGGSYTLNRFGKGLAPASSISSIYFRSSGNLALYAWSQDNGDITHDFLNFSVAAACFGKAAEPLGSTSACGHFQQGIGANGGPVSVGLNQVAIVNRFVGLNWISPFDWVSQLPTGIVPLLPVLYEGSITLNPSSVIGCSQAYPVGGYDC